MKSRGPTNPAQHKSHHVLFVAKRAVTHNASRKRDLLVATQLFGELNTRRRF
jgi:hypothetical protein